MGWKQNGAESADGFKLHRDCREWGCRVSPCRFSSIYDNFTASCNESKVSK